MPRAPRITRAQAVAVARSSPALATEREWMAGVVALALLLLALLSR